LRGGTTKQSDDSIKAGLQKIKQIASCLAMTKTLCFRSRNDEERFAVQVSDTTMPPRSTKADKQSILTYNGKLTTYNLNNHAKKLF